MNSAVDPFLIYFFLNKLVVGLMNSAATVVNSKFCLPETCEWKKKKFEENAEMKTQMLNPNPHSVIKIMICLPISWNHHISWNLMELTKMDRMDWKLGRNGIER